MIRRSFYLAFFFFFLISGRRARRSLYPSAALIFARGMHTESWDGIYGNLCAREIA